jgi:membrane protein YqaA with SNARE-associated domain
MKKIDILFKRDKIFEYNESTKKLNTVLLFSSFLLIIFIGFGFLFLKMDFQKENFPLTDFIKYIIFEIENKTFMGLIITSFFGGLFFLFFPLELYFFTILTTESNISNFLVPYVFGVIAAQITNYWLGLRLNRLCRLLIPPKNFYKMKGLLNKWGIGMILIMNCIPLPSPVFSTVLGAFKYNFNKFILFAILGIVILYSSLFASYFFLIKFKLELF